ncbi:MAG: hypothetical protein JWR10_4244 [Rubritepida sp.]|nr:hypothetical protein [Rubritepida sp.]
MNTRFTLAAGAFLLAAAAAVSSPASAQSYPRLVGGADNTTVEYGPGPRGNVVGGGVLTVVNLDQGKTAAVYADSSVVQRRTDGRVPVYVGTERNHFTAWVLPTPAAVGISLSSTAVPQG